MSHQFKPGDLALIVGCRTMTNFNGCCAEIIEHKGAWDFFGTGLQDWYAIRCGSFEGDARSGVLMPLRGDFESEQQKAKEAEPCV